MPAYSPWVYSPWIALGLFLATAALWRAARERARLQTGLGFLALWILVWLSSLLPAALHLDGAILPELSRALLKLAALQAITVFAFDVLLRRIHLPKFASEILLLAGYATVVFHLLIQVGVNVTGIFATSAVAAAVLGLALQDMLSNIASGVALQFEGGIRVGDYICVGEWAGWVRHVRLRHTAVTSAEGDTFILPNSQLTRSPVQICAPLHRQLIPLRMPYTVDPHEVIGAVEFALRASPLPGIAEKPAPACIIEELDPGFIRYAVVVWLTRPGYEIHAVSEVNIRLSFALRRAGIPAGEITHVLEMKANGGTSAGVPNPVDVLRRTPLLRLLSDVDLFELGAQLRHLSFAPGEHIIRQGDEGSSMYFVVSGQVAILYRSADGIERRISLMESGDFFGEASLLTGEIRSAGAVAESRVDCYRLDKDGLQSVIGRRPELAEDMAVVMAHRQMELSAVREQLDLETARLREAESQTQLLARIRRFFALAPPAA